jgi:hypothetical protein
MCTVMVAAAAGGAGTVLPVEVVQDLDAIADGDGLTATVAATVNMPNLSVTGAAQRSAKWNRHRVVIHGRTRTGLPHAEAK